MSRRTLLAVWFSVALGLSLPGAEVDAAEGKVPIAMIVAKSNPLSALSLHEVKRLYLGNIVTGPDGTRLLPFSLTTSSKERVGFDRTVLGMSPDAVARYWIDRKIRGQSGAPKAIASPDLMQRVVASAETSIGYVRADQVRADVKIVRIDGKVPGDPGYKIEY